MLTSDLMLGVRSLEAFWQLETQKAKQEREPERQERVRGEKGTGGKRASKGLKGVGKNSQEGKSRERGKGKVDATGWDFYGTRSTSPRPRRASSWRATASGDPSPPVVNPQAHPHTLSPATSSGCILGGGALHPHRDIISHGMAGHSRPRWIRQAHEEQENGADRQAAARDRSAAYALPPSPSPTHHYSKLSTA